MKIVFAAFKYDYADKSRGFSYEYFNFWGTLSRMYGDDIVYFPLDEKTMELGRNGMNKALLELVKREEPDVLFCNLFGDELKPKTIESITKNTKTITLNWFGDDQWRFSNFSKYWAPLFDWVATTDPNAVDKYKNIGYSNVIRSQYAANDQIYKPSSTEETYGVTFVGRNYGNRGGLVEFLQENGVSVDCWGKGWPNGRISQEKMVDVFSKSKISLNFTDVSASTLDLKTLIKTIAKVFIYRGVNNTYRIPSIRIIFRNIINFSLPKPRPQIKGRNFEIPACGGFLLTQEAEDLYNFYEYSKEIDVFREKEDLLEKANYYLKHDEECREIAKAGYERTMKEHTWEKRFSNVISSAIRGGKKVVK